MSLRAPHVVLGQVEGKAQVTPELEISCCTAAAKVSVLLGIIAALPGGVIETSMGIRRMVTAPNFVGSAADVAVIVTVSSAGIGEGAV